MTAVDPKFASSEYWFARPATSRVEAANYDALWNASETAARDCSFAIEREDYRTGLLSTKPLVSKQFFEFWKSDVVDFRSQVSSDLGTHRRVARFQILPREDGTFACEPKVVTALILLRKSASCSTASTSGS